MNVKRGYIDLSNDICVKWTSSKGLESYLLKENDIIIQMDGALIGKSYGIIKKKLTSIIGATCNQSKNKQ